MERGDVDPDQYLRSLPDDVAADMIQVDALIRTCMPGRRRDVWQGTFWGGTSQTIIGYGDLVQPRPRGEDVEWFIVGLARQKNHLSVYVNAVDGDQYLLQRFADRLGRVRTGAASITIKRLGDLDQQSFTDLVSAAHRLCPADR